MAFRARLRGWALDPRAWVTMLLVGVLIGATGAHFYEVQTQRDAIVLSARVALEDTAGGGGRAYWLLPIVVTNSGPEPVRIRSARLSEGPFQSGLRPVSENTEISPGSDTAISLRVTGGCAGGGPEVAPHWLVLSVVPDGRPARDIKVRLADDGGRFLATARQTCLDTDFGLWLSTEVTGDGVVTGNALLIKLRFRRNGDRPLGVSALRTTAPGLIAVAQPLPVAFQDDQSPPVGLLWTVSDCAQARGIGYDQIRLRAGITLPPGGGPVAEVNVLLYGDAVLAVVRFVLRSCG